MFKNVISQTPLTTPEANVYFNNITGDSFRGDVTFLTSMRALLSDRLGDEDTINLSFRGSSPMYGLPAEEEEESSVRSIAREVVRARNQLTIYTIIGCDKETSEGWARIIGKRFPEIMTSWHPVEKVTAFFNKVFPAYCFINPEKKSTVVFTSELDIRRIHYLQQGIFAFLPWFFDKEKGVSDLEMELLKSVCEKTSDKYEEVIGKYAEKYDFKSMRIRKLLDGFERKYELEQIDSVKYQIESTMEEINRLNDSIASYLRRKADYETTLFGLMAKLEQSDEESELMDYFMRNKHLSLRDVEGTVMSFVTMTNLDVFDEDMAERVINNSNSVLYKYCDAGSGISRAGIRRLMEAVFLEQTLKIQFCAAYSFDIRGGVSAIRDYNYGFECREYMANPHIDRYRCLGDYAQYINARLLEHDYIGAIEQCVASCKSLNFGDAAVMDVFSQRITRENPEKNNRCIVLPDGKVVTPKAAITWLARIDAKENTGSEEVA